MNIFLVSTMHQATFGQVITPSHLIASCAGLSRCRVRLETLWAIARQVPLSMGFCRQEYWSGLPCPPPGDLPYPGTKHRSLTLQANSLPSEPPGKAGSRITRTDAGEGTENPESSSHSLKSGNK